MSPNELKFEFEAYPSPPQMTCIWSQNKRRDGIIQRDSLPLQTNSLPSPIPPSPSNSSSRISPAVLFVIVILAVIFFVSGLLHILIRFLIKKKPSSSSSPDSDHHTEDLSNSDTLQRQLQQLFHLHDSGLDQAFIDALPVFLYREIVGSEEPFDCPVCLCEFSHDDELRLLPVCGHAFHVSCIDTWLLSNSTCPLCRGALFIQGVAVENAVFDFEEDVRLEKGEVPVKLGKFRSTSNENDQVGNGDGKESRMVMREEGESSSSNLDARRCYSMGSYQYVVGDTNLRVALRRGRGSGGDEEGKRLGVARKGESFSVSKIWLWRNKKGKFPDSSDSSSLDGGLPWMVARRSAGDV